MQLCYDEAVIQADDQIHRQNDQHHRVGVEILVGNEYLEAKHGIQRHQRTAAQVNAAADAGFAGDADSLGL